MVSAWALCLISMASLPDYAELHCLSNFSFLRGASHPDELVSRAAGARLHGARADRRVLACRRGAAHAAAKESGLPLIIGAEIARRDGRKLVLLATDRRSYGAISSLITRGRRRSKKAATRSGVPMSSRFPAAARCALDPRRRPTAGGMARGALSRRCLDRGGTALRAERSRQARALCGSQQSASACRWWPRRRAHASAHPAAAAGSADRDPPSAARRATAGKRLFANGERHLRSRRRLRALYPPELLAASVAIAERCRFSLDQLHYEYPAELVPAGRRRRASSCAC